MKISPEHLRQLPKTDLHVHLDGSLRLATLIDLAKRHGVTLPSYTEEGLHEIVFKERYADLVEYLRGFTYTCAAMQDPEALEQVAYEFMQDNVAEGVRYVEVRFAPQLHLNSRVGWRDVFLAVDRGLKRASDEANAELSRQNLDEPLYAYGIIVCALRAFDSGASEYYSRFLDVHRFMPRKRVYALASVELARASVELREQLGIPIVGFDLAGQEKGFPAIDHLEAFQFAHRNFLKKTVHAGEAYGPESIFQAITELHADRIGHGYYLFAADMVSDPSIEDPAGYVDDLAEYIADRRITVEVCLTSNLQTNPTLGRMEDHNFGLMRKAKLSTTICTDNRLVSNTTVTRELGLAMDLFELTLKDLRHILIYGFKRSFYAGSYTEKRAYVRSVIDYYERIEREVLVPAYGPLDDEKVS
jgi:adenosine deaminase